MARQKPGTKPQKDDVRRPAAAAPREKVLPSPPEGTKNRRRPIYLALLALIVLPAWVFWPVSGYEFVNWDDPTVADYHFSQAAWLGPPGASETPRRNQP